MHRYLRDRVQPATLMLAQQPCSVDVNVDIIRPGHSRQVKSVLTTLSGDEQVQLRAELEPIKDSLSLVEFDEEEVDERKGTSLRKVGVSERCLGGSGTAPFPV